ncbi:hypothetical protein CHUAL_005737 [Chamberlinius hualienensis]
MPLCTFNTNISACDIPCDFHTELAQLVAKVLNKPIERVTVELHSGVTMFRNGSTQPGAVFTIKSIAVFSAEKNAELAKPLQKFIEEKLGLKGNRLGIIFHDMKAEDVAWPKH